MYPIVIWFGRLGDMIILSSLLDILHRRFGKPCRLIGAGVWTPEIYRIHRDVAKVYCLRRYTPFLLDPTWWRTFWMLRRCRTQPVYVCEYDPRKLKRVRFLLRVSGTDPARCLFITDDTNGASDAGGPNRMSELAADGRKPTPEPVHWVDRLVSFGRRTPSALRDQDYPWPAESPLCAPRLEISETARADCDAWIQAQGWSGRPLILVQPGNRRTMRGKKLRVSPDDDKAWPIERWAALLHKVHAHIPEAVIVLCGAPKETLLLGWIHAAAESRAVVAAELPLERLMALCASAHSMISVDTGPAHAAAALGLPLVVLFGGHSQKEWLPRSGYGSPVIGIGGPPVSNRLDQISEDTVFETWRTMVDKLTSQSAGAARGSVSTRAG